MAHAAAEPDEDAVFGFSFNSLRGEFGEERSAEGREAEGFDEVSTVHGIRG